MQVPVADSARRSAWTLREEAARWWEPRHLAPSTFEADLIGVLVVAPADHGSKATTQP